MNNKLDILNRYEFVCSLINLVENISVAKTSVTFALDGKWGSGKSFVLDMFEEELSRIQSEETATDKYFIIRYNCWKNDYYQEPLIAIVSSIVSSIEEKTKLFPDTEENREIIGMIKATGLSLLSLGNTIVKDKIGLDIQGAVKTVLDGKKSGAEKYEDDKSYDTYFKLNKVIEKLSSSLQEIAKIHKIILVVDELDRCIPEYAINVLERLHHLTESNTNIITIISIDKEQLLSSVKQIFGFENPEKYLEKFINFEIKLDEGKLSEKITEKYSEYIDLFDKDIYPIEDSIEEFFQEILKSINIRKQEQILKKVMIAHKLMFTDKKDYAFMCMEILIGVMIFEYGYTALFENIPINGPSFEGLFSTGLKTSPVFTKFIKEKLGEVNFRREKEMPNDVLFFILPNRCTLYGTIAYTWYWMHTKNEQFIFQYYPNSVNEKISKNHIELKKYAEVLRML